MPDEPDKTASDDATLAVPGLLFVHGAAAERNVIRVGPAAGWMVPQGIARWERELSFVRRAEMTTGLAKALRATQPHEQIAPRKFPMGVRAVEASPVLALSNNLVEAARKEGARVHTVGVDRVSGDFYYFVEGGGQEPVRAQSNLIEMLAPSLRPSSTNAEIAALGEGLIDRLLGVLSEGVVSELEVELADALPRLSRDATGLEGTDLDAFESRARALASRWAHWEEPARRIVHSLAEAVRQGRTTARIPLYGDDAQRIELRPALEVQLSGKPLLLPPQLVWAVSGTPREELRSAAAPTRHAVAVSPRVATPPAAANPSHAGGQSRPIASAPRPVTSPSDQRQRSDGELRGTSSTPKTPPAADAASPQPVATPAPSKTTASSRPAAVAEPSPEPTAAASPMALPEPLTITRSKAPPRTRWWITWIILLAIAAIAYLGMRFGHYKRH
jgi:hypothetical protein